MAARENQGYLIAVILLAMLSIILAITTYFGFTFSSENASQLAARTAELEEEKRASSGHQALATMMSAYLGTTGAQITDVETARSQLAATGIQDLITRGETLKSEYELDMSKHATKPGAQDLTYRTLLNDIVQTIGDMHVQRTGNLAMIEQVEEKKRVELAAKDKELEARQQALDQARTDLATEKEQHETTRTELNDKLDLAQSTNQRLGQEVDSLKSTIAANEKKYEDELGKRANRIAQLSLEIERLTQTEVPLSDGLIVGVTPSQGKVTINLGSHDGIRPNQTFAVYDLSSTHFRSGEEKAKIEITRVLDEHLSEARVLSQRITNPILVRDFISTPAWDPGYSAPIAIGGTIDLDGDQVSDLQRLISIIEQNGGKVVAWHDEEGEIKGKIDENTRVFVVGDPPLGRARDAFNRLSRQRDDFQVRQVSVREFLNEIGYRSEAKIQEFNTRDEFIPRTPAAVDESTTNDSSNR